MHLDSGISSLFHCSPMHFGYKPQLGSSSYSYKSVSREDLLFRWIDTNDQYSHPASQTLLLTSYRSVQSSPPLPIYRLFSLLPWPASARLLSSIAGWPGDAERKKKSARMIDKASRRRKRWGRWQQQGCIWTMSDMNQITCFFQTGKSSSIPSWIKACSEWDINLV